MQSPSNELGTSVREAFQSDAQRIASLALQLGYEVPVAHVQRRLRELNAGTAIFVAVVPRVGVVGWIGVCESTSLTSSHRAEVEGLVVEDEYRSNGIGELLMHTAENWARHRGCTSLRLLSNIVRARAHQFYLRAGYEILKTEHVFQKQL